MKDVSNDQTVSLQFVRNGEVVKRYRFNMSKVPTVSDWMLAVSGFASLRDYLVSLTQEQFDTEFINFAENLLPIPHSNTSRARMHVAIAEAQRRNPASMVKTVSLMVGGE
jgi:hypothetical protein